MSTDKARLFTTPRTRLTLDGYLAKFASSNDKQSWGESDRTNVVGFDEYVHSLSTYAILLGGICNCDRVLDFSAHAVSLHESLDGVKHFAGHCGGSGSMGVD